MLRSTKSFNKRSTSTLYTWYINDTETKEPVPPTWHEETKTKEPVTTTWHEETKIQSQSQPPKASSTFGHIHHSNVFMKLQHLHLNWPLFKEQLRVESWMLLCLSLSSLSLQVVLICCSQASPSSSPDSAANLLCWVARLSLLCCRSTCLGVCSLSGVPSSNPLSPLSQSCFAVFVAQWNLSHCLLRHRWSSLLCYDWEGLVKEGHAILVRIQLGVWQKPFGCEVQPGVVCVPRSQAFSH